MKFPFNIKYRQKIESGEYKVETKDGSKARIICWDGFDEDRPIIAIVYDNQIEQYRVSGRYDDEPCNYDLYVITPDPEENKTREEEIKEAARIRANQFSHQADWNMAYHCFIQGAEWADKNPKRK